MILVFTRRHDKRLLLIPYGQITMAAPDRDSTAIYTADSERPTLVTETFRQVSRAMVKGDAGEPGLCVVADLYDSGVPGVSDVNDADAESVFAANGK